MNPKDLYSIEEARELLGGISRNSIYHLLRDGRLPSVPIGRRRFISAAAIDAFIVASTTTDPPEEVRGRIPRRRGAVQMRLGLKAPILSRSRRHLPDH
jgi:excisionase family DNA binding protein